MKTITTTALFAAALLESSQAVTLNNAAEHTVGKVAQDSYLEHAPTQTLAEVLAQVNADAEFLNDIGDWFEQAFSDAGSWVEGAVDDAGSWFEQAGEDVGGAFEDVGEWFEGDFVDFWEDDFVNFWEDDFVDFMENDFVDFWEDDFVDGLEVVFVDTIGNGLIEFGEMIGEGVMAGLDDIAEWGFWDDAEDFFVDGANGVIAVGQMVGNIFSGQEQAQKPRPNRPAPKSATIQFEEAILKVAKEKGMENPTDFLLKVYKMAAIDRAKCNAANCMSLDYADGACTQAVNMKSRKADPTAWKNNVKKCYLSMNPPK